MNDPLAMFRLAGKVSLVVGGGGGLGQSVAIGLVGKLGELVRER